MKRCRGRHAARTHFLPFWIVLFAALLATGCKTHISAERATTRQAYAQLMQSALSANGWSVESERVLHRHGLHRNFENDPAGTLRWLHDRAAHDDRLDLLFALAELNYLHGERLLREVRPLEARKARDHHLAAALYAWFFLFADRSADTGPLLTRQTLLMGAIYNRAVAKGFLSSTATNATVVPAGGPRTIPPGTVAIDFNPEASVQQWHMFETFMPADDYLVHGLSTRNVQEGLGAALIVVGRQPDSRSVRPHFAATLFLRVEGTFADWSAGRLRAGLELYLATETNTVNVAGQKIPLHADLTAPLAYALNNSSLWSIGRAQFYSSREGLRPGIQKWSGHQPGKVPVIFVHGTWSSPIRWAEMWNTLVSDPVLRARCQFWSFNYNSGNPVSYSAIKLRESIAETVRQLDPEGRDPALRQMVVIGHSQGGLLTKLTAVNTGDKLWRAFSGKGLEALDSLPPGKRADLAKHFVSTPEPGVQRVVFIATPHRGSYLAFGFARQLFARLVALPTDLLDLSSTILTLGESGKLGRAADAPMAVRWRVPTSIDSMSPRSPYLLALADVPTAPGITAHSIVSIKGDESPPEGRDGLVNYTSAHVDYAASELIVRDKHSCLENPATIEEVRRILLEHLDSVSSSGSTVRP